MIGPYCAVYNWPLSPDEAGAVCLHGEAGVHIAEARADHHPAPERGGGDGLAHTSQGTVPHNLNYNQFSLSLIVNHRFHL